MKYVFSIGLLCALGLCLVLSCEKYKDSKATPDPRLTNPYCNDPAAVNFNWGFPGKVDNSTCFYPTDVFKGTYTYHDSVFLQPSNLFIGADSFVMTINKLSDSTMQVFGFCSNGNGLMLKARPQYVATVDTLVGYSDSLYHTSMGQFFCASADTVNGTFTKDIINDSLIYVNLQVISDTGVISTHIGTARRN